MLTTPARLTAAQLAGVDDLVDRVVAADGGRLKLDRAGMRARDGAAPLDVLAADGARVVGCAAVDVVGGVAEIAGAVDPDHRRRGTGTALLAAALDLLPALGVREALLVVPAGSAAGTAFARSAGALPSHSEHALHLTSLPPAVPEDPATTLRAATPADLPALRDVLSAAFGAPPPVDLAAVLAGPARTLLVERGGRVVGTLRVSLVDPGAHGDGTATAVHGFAVHPDHQRRGTGRDVLARVCREAFAGGAQRVELEVAVDNAGASGLYAALGFRRVAGEDYHRLPRRAPRRAEPTGPPRTGGA